MEEGEEHPSAKCSLWCQQHVIKALSRNCSIPFKSKPGQLHQTASFHQVNIPSKQLHH